MTTAVEARRAGLSGRWWLAALPALMLWACGGGGGGGGGGTDGGTVPQRALSVQVLVADSVPATDSDALGAAPAEWGTGGFGRTLAHADWLLAERPEVNGRTDEQGSFAVTGLDPGRYTLVLRRTLNGRLLEVEVPIQVGEGGGGEVTVEIREDAVRAVSRFPSSGGEGRLVGGTDQPLVVVEEGVIREIAGGGTDLVDRDGDGMLEPIACPNVLWQCGASGACENGTECVCASSCPLCEDCRSLVCAPPGVPGVYRCEEDGSCLNPGDSCVCVASCPDCDDCVEQVCVPPCEPVQVTELKVNAPESLQVGQRGQATAWAALSDGRTIEVTRAAEWSSSDPTVLEVDSWGGLFAVTAGSAEIFATLGDLVSDPVLVQVQPRGAVRRVWVENLDCILPFDPRPAVPADALPEIPDSILPPPACRNVVRVGQQLHFAAFAEFESGAVDNVTEEAEWIVEPPQIGEAKDGVFVALQPGSAEVSAALEGVRSEPVEVRVVERPTVVALEIYPEQMPIPLIDVVVPPGLPQPDFPIPCLECPCPECGWTWTMLVGDEVQFRATATYDTGEWEDVTEKVVWRSSAPEVAAFDEGGLLIGESAGEASVWAELDDVKSNSVGVRVVEEAHVTSLDIYQEGNERVIAAGDQAYFHATAYYDVAVLARDVTSEAEWHSSDPDVASFEEPGVLTGHAAGTVRVWAELDGVRSPELSIEVFVFSELEYCDPDHINRGTWSDGFNRVTLESDCAYYYPGDVAALRFTATEIRPRFGILDPCLDLFAYRGDRLVRVIREEGCGEPFFPGAAPELDNAPIKYQLQAFWDLKDDRGQPVEPGTYTIYGHFYLYFDPVVSIQVEVLGEGAATPTPRPPATPTPIPPPGGFRVTGHVAEFPPCQGAMRGVSVVLEGVSAEGERIERVTETGVGPDPDSAGGFRFDGVPAGDYLLRVEPPCGAFGCWEPVQVEVRGDVDVRVCMEDFPPPVCTPVACPDGVLECPPDDPEGCPGGCGTVCVTPTPTPHTDLPSCAECLRLPPLSACLLNWAVRGRVMEEESGRPVAEARVEVNGVAAVSAGDGSYTAEGTRPESCSLDYEVSIHAEAPGYRPFETRFYTNTFPVTLDIPLAPAGPPPVTPTPIPPPGGFRVTGHVAEFPPCQGAMRGVSVVLEGVSAEGELIELVTETGVGPDSDSAGGFRFDGVPAGDYLVRVEPPCGAFGCWEPVPVDVKGDVDVRVCMEDFPPPVCTPVACPDGVLECPPDDPEGCPGGCGVVCVTPTPTPGGDLPSCADCLRLPPLSACLLNWAVRGRVVEEESGRPVAEARVEVNGVAAVSAGDGSYTAEGTRPESCSLDYEVSIHAEAPGYRPFETRFYTNTFPVTLDIPLAAAVAVPAAGR